MIREKSRRLAAASCGGALLLAALAGGAVSAADAPPAADAAQEASIPFANHHGIYTWKVVNDKTVLIQSQDRQWYKATLMTACFDLPFAETIGFETNADGSFDKFGAIKLRDQNCPLVSLVKTDPPAKQGKKAPASAPASSTPPAAAATP
jgi:hypothetical protein